MCRHCHFIVAGLEGGQDTDLGIELLLRCGGGTDTSANHSIPAWHLNKPSAHHPPSGGLSSTLLSSSPFSVPHTSGRPSLLPFSSSRYSQSITLSYKDFSECFPLWCEEQPNGAEGVFNTVSSFIETHIVVRFSHSIHIHPTQLLTLRLAYAPFPPGRATLSPPFFRDGNSRPTQINCSNSMTSRKT